MRHGFTARCAVAIAILPAAVLGEQRDTARATTARPQTGVCLAVVQPASVGIKGDAPRIESAARELLIGDLADPSLKVLPLEARLRAPAIEEARQSECGRVLTMTLTQKAGGGRVKSLTGKIAEGAGTWSAWSIPGAGVAGAAARGAALAGAAAIASLAASTRAQDVLQIDYEIVEIVHPSDSSGAGAQTERLKAGADGEDLLTPLMRRVAERVHPLVTSR